jgi:hypothetical protein
MMVMAAGALLSLSALPAVGQQNEAPEQAQPVSAVAAVVQGRVFQAPVGVRSTDTAAWTRVAQGDEIPAGQQVRTSLRSSVLLHFGDDTALQVRPLTLASLDELYETSTTRRTKVGLAYGAIRGSVVEKTLRSDMVIEAPTATLSKEGTENFELMVVRGRDAWYATGPTTGLIAIRDGMSGRVARVSFHQLVSFLNVMDTAARRTIFQRTVDFFGNNYLTGGEADFNVFFSDGTAVAGPGLGSCSWDYVPDSSTSGVGGRAALRRQFVLPDVSSLIFRQPESRFGTGPRPEAAKTLRRAIAARRR